MLLVATPWWGCLLLFELSVVCWVLGVNLPGTVDSRYRGRHLV